jgi:alanine racemase
MDYYRDTFMEINLDDLEDNIRSFQHHYFQSKEIMAVVKADAYGHGSVQIARVLQEQGIRHFAVATLEEAMELRHSGIHGCILLFGHIRVCDLHLAATYDCTLSINHLGWFKEALAGYIGKPLHVHINVDTGMNRLGVPSKEEFVQLLVLLSQTSHFTLKGIYSHLATSEEENDTYYQLQLRRFASFLDGVDTTDLWIHIANSGGSIKEQPNYFNMIRIGLFLHGVSPSDHIKLAFPLKETMSLFTTVLQIKTLPRGEKISYNGIYVTTDDQEVIATLPIGYADGLDRRIEGGRVFVNGDYGEIIGRVCMDFTIVKLPRIVEVGSIVEIIGPHISMEEYARKVKTNTYHAFCAFSDRIVRKYIRHHQVVEVVNKRLNQTCKEDL